MGNNYNPKNVTSGNSKTNEKTKKRKAITKFLNNTENYPRNKFNKMINNGLGIRSNKARKLGILRLSRAKSKESKPLSRNEIQDKLKILSRNNAKKKLENWYKDHTIGLKNYQYFTRMTDKPLKIKNKINVSPMNKLLNVVNKELKKNKT
jgi:hypothetical protein